MKLALLIALGFALFTKDLPAAAAVGDFLVRAASFEKSGESQKALAAYLEADKQAPGRADILVKIAKQHGDLMTETRDESERKRHGEQCLEYSNQALKAAPNQADPHLSIAIATGKLTEFMGNRDKIEASRTIKRHAEKALSLDPRSDYAHHMLGRWHQELASMGTASRAIAKVIYGGLPEASYQEALDHFNQARKLRPDRLIHRIEHGRTLAMMGRNEEAKEELTACMKATANDKDDVEAKGRAKSTLSGL